MATEVKLVSSSAPSLTALVDSAPGALNTLNELAAALGDDANFSTTVTNSIAAKLPLAGGTLTGGVVIGGDSSINRGNQTSGELLIGGTTDGGFVDFDGTSLQLNTQRDPNTGTFINTSKSHGGITIVGSSADSHIKFYTINANNTVASERMRIDKNGKVGIGTSSPSAALDVVANDTVWATEITQSNTSNGDGLNVTIGSTASADYALSIRSDAGNTPGLNVKGDGSVGIGTFAPESLLHVDGSFDGPLVTIHQTGGASSNYGGLVVETSSTGANIAEFKNAGTRYARFTGNGRMVLENKAGAANNPLLEMINTGSSTFNHSIEISCPNLGAGETNGVFIGKYMSTRDTGYVGYRWNSSASNDNYIHLSHWGADYLFYVKGNGDYYHAGSSVSDRDLKENIMPVPGTSLDKIINLPIKSFRMKQVDNHTTEVRHQKTGFIAQEVQEVLPDVVTGTDGQKDMGIDPTGIIAHLVRAVTELEARVKELEG